MFCDEHDLIERCIRREEKAWDKFIRRFTGLLYYSARARLDRSGIRYGSEELDDIVQSIFLEIWQKSMLEKVRDSRRIDAWLSIIGQTRALNYMRQKKERLMSKEELNRIAEITDGAEGIDLPIVKAELAEKLERIIDAFPPKEKIILKLNIIYDKKHREIARFMNLSLNTVSTIIARRKEIIKKMLRDIV